MATARGITETKLYDRQARDRPLRDPARADPRLLRPQGRHVGQHPRRPRHRRQDGRAAAAAVRRRSRASSSTSTRSRAPSASENLIDHADDARISKQLATMVRDIPVDVDPVAFVSAEPDRSRLREVFREFELRDPLRRLEEALGERRRRGGRAAAGGRPAVARARARRAALADARGARRRRRGGRARRACARARRRASCSPTSEAWRFGAYAGGDEALAGECGAPDELAAALGERPVARARREGARHASRRGSRTTRCVAAYLLDPARRGYPLDELCEERGIGAEVEDADRARRGARARARRRAARADRGARAAGAAARRRAAARARAARDGAGRPQARHASASPRSATRVARRGRRRSSARSGTCAARSS